MIHGTVLLIRTVDRAIKVVSVVHISPWAVISYYRTTEGSRDTVLLQWELNLNFNPFIIQGLFRGS